MGTVSVGGEVAGEKDAVRDEKRGADGRADGSLQRLRRGLTHEQLLEVVWDIAREGGLENQNPQVNHWGGDLGVKNFGSPSQTKTRNLVESPGKSR